MTSPPPYLHLFKFKCIVLSHRSALCGSDCGLSRRDVQGFLYNFRCRYKTEENYFSQSWSRRGWHKYITAFNDFFQDRPHSLNPMNWHFTILFCLAYLFWKISFVVFYLSFIYFSLPDIQLSYEQWARVSACMVLHVPAFNSDRLHQLAIST